MKIFPDIICVLILILYPWVAPGEALTVDKLIYKPVLANGETSEKKPLNSEKYRTSKIFGKEIWVGDPNWGSSLQDAITALGNHNATLRVPPGIHNITSDLIIPENLSIKVERGAILSIANAKKLIIKGGLEAGPYQIFSWTGTGAIWIGNYVDWVLPEWFGAKPDAITDSGDAIRKAMTTLNAEGVAYKSVKFHPGIYVINTGQILLDDSDKITGQIVEGAGMGLNARTIYDITEWHGGTILKFKDNTVDALVKVDTKKNSAIWQFGKLTLQGPGKTAGTNIHGLWLTNTDAVNYTRSLFRSKIEDILVTDVSGSGFHGIRIWDSEFIRCSAFHTGRHGFFISGNNRFLRCGQYNNDIGHTSLWLLNGAPFIDRFNTAECYRGAKFGVDQADKVPENLPDWFQPPSSPGSRCFPTVFSLNIEPATNYGIDFSVYSNFAFATNILIQAKEGHNLPYAISWRTPNRTGLIVGVPTCYGPGTFTNYFVNNYAAPIGPHGGVVFLCRWGEWESYKTKIGGDSPGAFFPLQTRGDSVATPIKGVLEGADDGSRFLLGGAINLCPQSFEHHNTNYKAGDIWFSGNGLQIAQTSTVKVGIYQGQGAPEGVVSAPPGSLYLNNLGGTSTLWVKQSGTGKTGWFAK